MRGRSPSSDKFFGMQETIREDCVNQMYVRGACVNQNRASKTAVKLGAPAHKIPQAGQHVHHISQTWGKCNVV